jgi:AcrR family transcriptional regulator
MTEKQKDTETQILDAARKVFLENGFDGATMQMIAGEAGINKALLHYYYRSKDRLFEAIFIEAFSRMIPNLMKIFVSEMDFEDKIRAFVETYIGALQENPQIPLFILHELHRNPGRIIELIQSTGLNPAIFFHLVEEQIQKGVMSRIDPRQLMVNMLALCIFPFAARPMIQGFIFRNNTEAYEEFLNDRKQLVADFIIKAIKP